jgi:hypothetical protein
MLSVNLMATDTNQNEPQITFGIIVLNGVPFLRYNLRSLYPFAHQIIVVEGACPASKNVATLDGHSRDGTLDELRRFILEEDPMKKLLIVTAEDEGHPNGFWKEKEEMSEAYARRSTGNYLWQVDADEFYLEDDIKAMIDLLRKDRTISGATFRTLTFWGGLKYKVHSSSLEVMIQDVHRLFQWAKGYRYVSHRPPTVVNAAGENTRAQNWMKARLLQERGILMYHYPFLFPKQVREKCDYYSNATWIENPAEALSSLDWAEECYMKFKWPFRVYYKKSELSYLDDYAGKHPQQVVQMVEDVGNGVFPGVTLRSNGDVEKITSSPIYRVRKPAVKAYIAMYGLFYRGKMALRSVLIKTPFWNLLRCRRTR